MQRIIMKKVFAVALGLVLSGGISYLTMIKNDIAKAETPISNQSLMAYYSFNDNHYLNNAVWPPFNVKDDSGNGMDGWTSGQCFSGNTPYGLAVVADGYNYLIINDPEEKLNLTNYLTLEAWIYWNGPVYGDSNQTIFCRARSFCLYIDNDGYLRFSNGTPAWNQSHIHASSVKL
jgi:hypothetical protein